MEIDLDKHTGLKVDLVIGIPSYNEEENISFLTQVIDEGLVKYYGDLSTIIVNVDNNSMDNTKHNFLSTRTITPKIYISTKPGVIGKGNNFFNLFQFAQKSHAKAVVCIDADIKSITPEWIKFLAQPVFDGYDYVTPIYSRHKFDGTITNQIIYPLVYGLLAKDIRQPIGGDFGFSTKLGNYWLAQEWHDTTREYGIDIFMTLNAIFGGFKICTASLGAKIHKPSAPKLGKMFLQVLNTLFSVILDNKDKWIHATHVEEMMTYGYSQLVEPPDVYLDLAQITQTAKAQYMKNKESIKIYVAKKLFNELEKVFQQEKLNISKELWAHLMYDFIYSYNISEEKSNLIEAMVALYFARVASFKKEFEDATPIQAESEIRAQGRIFLAERDYLVQKLKQEKIIVRD